MLTQELTNHRRAARARAFARAQSTSSQLEALNAQVASLQQTVLTLQAEVDALREDLTAVQSNNVQALDSFVSVDPKPEIGVEGRASNWQLLRLSFWFRGPRQDKARSVRQPHKLCRALTRGCL